MTTTPSAGTDGEQNQAWVCLLVDAVTATIDVLQRLDVFFREHADSTVHARLGAFCAATGGDPVCGPPALLDELGLRALLLQTALTGSGEARS
jgi:hypothetical protein